MTYFMSPDSNHWRRRRRGPAQNTPRGPNPKANDSHPKWRGMAFLPCDDVTVRYYWTIYLVNGRVTSLTSVWAGVEHLPRSHKFVLRGRGRTFTARRTVVYSSVFAPWKEIHCLCRSPPTQPGWPTWMPLSTRPARRSST